MSVQLDRYGPWALVTGAAQGLGAAFSRQIAASGLNLVLVDINQSALEKTAASIRQDYSVDTRCVTLDLTADDFLERLLPQIESLPIHLLINNAGLSSITPFLTQSRDFLLTQLHLNTRAVLVLTHHFAERMVSARRGGILIVSSTAAELPSAFNAAYSASKAYELNLAESLWDELKPHGVDVLGFMPVMTDTGGLSGQGYQAKQRLMDPDVAAKEALTFLGRKPSVLAGRSNRWLFQGVLKLIPKPMRIKLVGQQIQQMFRMN